MPMHSLRRRMVAAFALFALVTAMCFSAFSLLFVYTVEDSFFDKMLIQEADHQHAAWRASGTLAPPLRGFVSVHRSAATLPADLARQVAGRADGREFAGEQGRHYHLQRLALDGGASAYVVAEVSRELVVRPRLAFILTFLGLSALGILAVTLGIGYWLARRATEPLVRLNRLVSGADPAHLPRHFSHQFPANEIGALASALDQALERIAGLIAREQHFTRDASHELRTPLAIIDGAAQLLADQPMAPQGAAQLQRIRAACAHMAQTVDTLLSLAREELNPAPAQPVALLPLVETTVLRFAHLLDGKSIDVQVDVGPHDKVCTHPAALAILLGNLVSNAFGHAAQGAITIAFAGDTLTVTDSGPGIEAALRERLYQSGSKGAASGGSGLGLSIAARLAARCGITLALDDASQGGTRASLHFQG